MIDGFLMGQPYRNRTHILRFNLNTMGILEPNMNASSLTKTIIACWEHAYHKIPVTITFATAFETSLRYNEQTIKSWPIYVFWLV